MADPTNEHYVHGDGYEPEWNDDPDPERLAVEIEDEIENRLDFDGYEDLRVEYGTEVWVRPDDRSVRYLQQIANDFDVELIERGDEMALIVE